MRPYQVAAIANCREALAPTSGCALLLPLRPVPAPADGEQVSGQR